MILWKTKVSQLRKAGVQVTAHGSAVVHLVKHTRYSAQDTRFKPVVPTFKGKASKR